jgi:hypothetical protein
LEAQGPAALDSVTVDELYECGIKDLPPIERFRLATLILERLRDSGEAADELEQAWTARVRGAASHGRAARAML